LVGVAPYAQKKNEKKIEKRSRGGEGVGVNSYRSNDLLLRQAHSQTPKGISKGKKCWKGEK